MTIQPLKGLKVLDFSTLLPGPMAGLILAEAGAEVIKIERPGGDDMRRFAPEFGEDSGCFALLNRGKNTITLDLKNPAHREQALRLASECDVLIEQFRPGVMQRLGLCFEDVRRVRPGIVYCSITGYGQDGPKARVAGHDLNYLAETGMLGLARDTTGAPPLPPGLIADIGGGALPAVFNILLALRHAEATGEGCQLDISMTDNLFAWQYTALALAHAGDAAKPGGELNTGGSPRYQVYRTKDDRFIAAAPMEQVFWDNFCEAIELPCELRNDSVDPARCIVEIRKIFLSRTLAQWLEAFAGRDVCCSPVVDTGAAIADQHFISRGLFSSSVTSGGRSMPALPVPLAPVFRPQQAARASPTYQSAPGSIGDAS